MEKTTTRPSALTGSNTVCSIRYPSNYAGFKAGDLIDATFGTVVNVLKLLDTIESKRLCTKRNYMIH